MSSTDIFTVLIIGLSLIIILLSTRYNPLIYVAKRIIDANQINVGPYIRMFERDNDRLIVVEPEQIVMYNTAGALYYYFEGGASRRLCPINEFAIVRFTKPDIYLINETGTYNITCTTTSSLNMYGHFNNNSYSWNLPVFNDSHSIIDIINYLLSQGYIYIR
ncbi:19KD [Choristoneura occidentalis granulovirus]|uniref:19KD n=1 Tax=Choristoneura occidentalis granulovirus TaxID=364745 RepID=Q1A4M6_9BBAC|nr:19KD [Choristoneura fumiferana granulovirus]ABC61204.1 19KD [Choristoneura fumiferana granulovirus]